MDCHAPSHCSNIFCMATGSAGMAPNGAADEVADDALDEVAGAASAEPARADRRTGRDEEEDLEAAIPAV
jgi:hypothetical protein